MKCHLVNLKAHNGDFVAALEWGGGALVANRKEAALWESFLVLSNGDLNTEREVVIATTSGYFWCAEGGGGDGEFCNANRLRGDVWERFVWIPQPDGRVALKTSNGRFVRAENGGGTNLRADAKGIDIHERFKVEPRASFDMPEAAKSKFKETSSVLHRQISGTLPIVAAAVVIRLTPVVLKVVRDLAIGVAGGVIANSFHDDDNLVNGKHRETIRELRDQFDKDFDTYKAKLAEVEKEPKTNHNEHVKDYYRDKIDRAEKSRDAMDKELNQ